MSVEQDPAMRNTRADIMRSQLGPCLDGLLRPIYQEDITSLEASRLAGGWPIEGVEDIVGFAEKADTLLSARLDVSLDEEPAFTHYQNLFELINESGIKLTFNGVAGTIQEGVRTGIVMPLNLAMQIHSLESEKKDRAIDTSAFEASKLVEIMERESFDDILMRLTRGPNGFLGSRASSIAELRGFARSFFSFPEGDQRLSIERAYSVSNGEVTGLSGLYFVAANHRRQNAREIEKINPNNNSGDSSGCPVRHNFPDPETGEGQEPLVITAKKFLVEALRVSQQQVQEAV